MSAQREFVIEGAESWQELFQADEEICVRALRPKGAPENTLTWRTCGEALACDPALMAEIREANHTRGIYCVVNSGGLTN